MRLARRWKAHLLRSPIYLLLSTGAASMKSTTQQQLPTPHRQDQRRRGGPGGPADTGGTGSCCSYSWLRLLKRKLAVACRPRSLARIFGAVLVAVLLIFIVTKSYSMRRRAVCKCVKFTYSQCQPYDGRCGQGVKKAFCQQKRCQPRRKLVRCATLCGEAEGGAAAAPAVAGSVGMTDGARQRGSGCSYAVRRQSRWTKCMEATEHRSRILFLHSGSPRDCPATKTERRSCKSQRPRSEKDCTYEPRGTWTACNRERNEIVNTRKLTDGSVNNCPMEVRTAMRCLKRDGQLKCIYSKWTKWSHCVNGSRHKVRTLIQGTGCTEVTRLDQRCRPDQSQGLPVDADTVVRK